MYFDTRNVCNKKVFFVSVKIVFFRKNGDFLRKKKLKFYILFWKFTQTTVKMT